MQAIGMMRELFVGPSQDPDRIRLGPAVASGAEGILYRGFIDRTTEALPVAVKMLHPDHLDRLADWVARWREQVELLRSVAVPGLVSVRTGFVGSLPHPPGDSVRGRPTLYLVMDWIDG